MRQKGGLERSPLSPGVTYGCPPTTQPCWQTRVAKGEHTRNCLSTHVNTCIQMAGMSTSNLKPAHAKVATHDPAHATTALTSTRTQVHLCMYTDTEIQRSEHSCSPHPTGANRLTHTCTHTWTQHRICACLQAHAEPYKASQVTSVTHCPPTRSLLSFPHC